MNTMTSMEILDDATIKALVKRAFGLKFDTWTNPSTGEKSIGFDRESVQGKTWAEAICNAHVRWPDPQASRPTRKGPMALLSWIGELLANEDYHTEFRKFELTVSNFKRAKGETINKILEALRVREFVVSSDEGIRFRITVNQCHNVISVCPVVPPEK